MTCQNAVMSSWLRREMAVAGDDDESSADDWQDRRGYGAGNKTVDELKPPPASVVKKAEKAEDE